MITDSLKDLKSENLFYYCKEFIPSASVFLKLEGLNIAGSIKLKTANYLLNNLEYLHQSKPGINKIIESSSGNLGVALSILCKERGYDFICVTDPNISADNEIYMKLLGATVIKVTERDSAGGYLTNRINLIQQLLQANPSYLWTNQYANESNIEAHYHETAKEIFVKFPKLDFLFVGAGTTGTLMGCAKFFKEYSPNTKIIAVDTEGSVTFGYPPGKRYIPGLGTSRQPEIANKKWIDEIILVHEKHSVAMCHHLLDQYGLILGGSTGAVMYAVKEYANKKYVSIANHSQIVAISPDFGNKYIDTIYNQEWVKKKFSVNQPQYDRVSA